MRMSRKRQGLAGECTQIAPAPDWREFIVRPDDEKFTDIRDAPQDCGVYGWYSEDRDLVYVGRSVNIANRLHQHRMGTLFFGGEPTYFSFRLVPKEFFAGVEVAHIDVLNPPENKARDSRSTPFQAELKAEIENAWREVWPAQLERMSIRSMRMAEQIAARL